MRYAYLISCRLRNQIAPEESVHRACVINIEYRTQACDQRSQIQAAYLSKPESFCVEYIMLSPDREYVQYIIHPFFLNSYRYEFCAKSDSLQEECVSDVRLRKLNTATLTKTNNLRVAPQLSNLLLDTAIESISISFGVRLPNKHQITQNTATLMAAYQRCSLCENS